jgi:hypothetical protein
MILAWGTGLSTGIEAHSSIRATIAFNSIVACVGFLVAGTGADVHSNLFIAAECSKKVALDTACMSAAPTSNARRNAFAGFATMLHVYGNSDASPCDSGGDYVQLSEAESTIQSCVPGTSPDCDRYGPARADDNVVLRGSCDPSEAKCVAVPVCSTISSARRRYSKPGRLPIAARRSFSTAVVGSSSPHRAAS